MKAPSGEIYGKSTQRKEHNAEKYIQWVTTYNAVADSTGLTSFV